MIKITLIISLSIIGIFFLTNCEKESGLPVDGDGNKYHTVVIGTQTWLKENLKTTKYCGGGLISLVTDNKKWEDCQVAAYSWYNNDEVFKDIYGGLYNYDAVKIGVLCPVGYHVPTKDEWTTLANYMIDAPEAIKQSFKAHTTGWRVWDGSFMAVQGSWWISSSDGSTYRVTHDFSITGMPENSGFSVRCIKNN